MNMDANRGNNTPKTTTEYHYGTKKVRAVYNHTRYWVDHYKEFDKEGNTLCEFGFRHNKPEGPGFLTENGKKVEKFFTNGKVYDIGPDTEQRKQRYLKLKQMDEQRLLRIRQKQNVRKD